MCSWSIRSFISWFISTKRLATLPQKVEAIQNFLKPQNVKELRRFLGMVNFYHRFIPDIASAQSQLQEAITGHKQSSQTQIEWTTEKEATFKKLKDDLANATLLTFPDPLAQFSLQTDASGSAIGAVLQQWQDQTWKPLSFFSRKLTSAQCNYSAYDRELLAIYVAIKHSRFMLEGREFFVITDHKPLIFAFSQKLDRASPRQCRQLTYISEFTTDIRHVSSDKNI